MRHIKLEVAKRDKDQRVSVVGSHDVQYCELCSCLQRGGSLEQRVKGIALQHVAPEETMSDAIKFLEAQGTDNVSELKDIVCKLQETIQVVNQQVQSLICAAPGGNLPGISHLFERIHSIEQQVHALNTRPFPDSESHVLRLVQRMAYRCNEVQDSARRVEIWFE